MVRNLVQRRLAPILKNDLAEKMVLLVGPRQCGKTFLSKELARDSGRYYSWDNVKDRTELRRGTVDPSKRLWVFDELHKYRGWRNWLKGTFDVHHEHHQILVTGSARLDLVHRVGDSMSGRFFLHHLHPFTAGELAGSPIAESGEAWLSALRSLSFPQLSSTLDQLFQFGGFPEPFLAQSERSLRRWQANYLHTIVREDIATLEAIRDLDKVEMLYERASQLVGSPLSINAQREDLEASHSALRTWLTALERVYAIFRVPPFGPPRLRAVKKEQKLYMCDWSRVENRGARWENLVACHLQVFVHWAQDVWGEKWELRYFRTALGQEVDFVLLRQNRPVVAIEVKASALPTDKGLRYLCSKVKNLIAIQTSAEGVDETRVDTTHETPVFHVPLSRFLGALP